MDILFHFLLACACAMTLLKSAQAQCASATWGKVQKAKQEFGPFFIKAGTGETTVDIPFKGMPGCHPTGVTAVTCDAGPVADIELAFVGDYSVRVLRLDPSRQISLKASVYCEGFYGQEVHDYHFDDKARCSCACVT